MEEIYRFRSIENLLGKYKELESQEIYFAAPEELNDPIEGFREVYWQGDKIVWKNFFKNYITQLEYSLFQCFSLKPNEQPRINLDFNYSIDELPEKRKIALEKIYEYFFQIEIINEFIDCLKNNRKISKNELAIFLSDLHFPILQIITNEYEKLNINFFTRKIYDLQNIQLTFTSEWFKNIDDIVALHGKEASSSIIEIITQRNRDLNLIDKLKHNGLDQIQYFLLQEFPDFFLEQLNSLVYPRWYTACFMTSFSNSSIWGTYGNNHKGICLIYNISKEEDSYFLNLKYPNGQSSNGLIVESNKVKLYPIHYDKKPVEINFFKSIGRLPINKLLNNWYMDNGLVSSISGHLNNKGDWHREFWENFIHSVTVKTPDWQHENEYRAIENELVINYSNPNLRKFKYNFNDLKGVIFGINTSEQDKISIIKIIYNKCIEYQHKNFKFYQAYFCHTDKCIKRYEITDLKFSF